MSTAAPATKKTSRPPRPHPPGPISEQGAMKNTLHNTLCNERPRKLIGGAEERKNREIMPRPFSIVLSSGREGRMGGMRGFTDRNANRLSWLDAASGTKKPENVQQHPLHHHSRNIKASRVLNTTAPRPSYQQSHVRMYMK